MLDIGGWEFLLIAVIGIMIIGPKELPGAIRTVSSFVRRARELARDFQSGLEDVAREAEIDELSKDMTGIDAPGSIADGLQKQIEDVVDPEGELRESMDYDAEWTDDDLLDIDPELDDVNRIGARQKTEPETGADSSDAPTSEPDADAADAEDAPAKESKAS